MTPSITLKELRSMMHPSICGAPEAYAVAEKQAYKFLRLTGCQDPADVAPAIASLARLTIDRLPSLPVSGAVDWTGTHWQILLNADDAPVRQRFSLAHELKHIIDHPYMHPAVSYEHTESVCNYFAGCLLMPRPWLKRAWTSGIQDIGRLSGSFGVSRQAMKVRLEQVGLLVQPSGTELDEQLSQLWRTRYRSSRFGGTQRRYTRPLSQQHHTPIFRPAILTGASGG